MAPQRLEKIESAPGNGMAPEAPDPQDMVQRRDGASRRLSTRPTKLLSRSRRRRPARKWRRKSSRRLNPRPEMVWLRKARAPKIWRRRLRTTRQPNRRKPERRQTGEPPDDAQRGHGLLKAGSVSDDVVAREGNFPPRKPLISHETGKESRVRHSFRRQPRQERERGVRGAAATSALPQFWPTVLSPAFPPGVIAPSRAAPTKTAGPDVFSASF